MDHKIKVLGIEIDNCPSEDSVKLSAELLEKDGMSIIHILFMDFLIKTGEDPELFEYIKRVDLSIPGQNDILEAGGVIDTDRKEEIENYLFLKQFLTYATESHRTVFLLSQTEDSLNKLYDSIITEYESLPIAGKFALENSRTDDMAVNEINSVAPDIVLSIVPSVDQEYFVMNNRNKLSTKVWLGCGNIKKTKNDAKRKINWMNRFMEKTLFWRKVSQYNSKRDD